MLSVPDREGVDSQGLVWVHAEQEKGDNEQMSPQRQALPDNFLSAHDQGPVQQQQQEHHLLCSPSNSPTVQHSPVQQHPAQPFILLQLARHQE